MEQLAISLAGELDSLRVRVLKIAMRSSFIRSLFCSRAKRLLTLFLFALVLQLILAVYFPVPILVIGPLLFGAPHLISSLRYAMGRPKMIFKTKLSKITISAGIWIFPRSCTMPAI